VIELAQSIAPVRTAP